jgi:hypothetical protein
MIIEKVDRNKECYGEYSLEGSVLRIGDIEIDLEGEQMEQEVLVPIVMYEGSVHRGLLPCCEYVAEVIIPPRHYETVKVAAKEEGMEEERVAVPLDIHRVVLKLWPISKREEKEGGIGNGI